MTRWFVDIEGGYYDFYNEITEFGVINLAALSRDIENYKFEAQLAIL
jgi:hypothetical protein